MLSQSQPLDASSGEKWVVLNTKDSNSNCFNKKRRIDETNSINVKEFIIHNISKLYLSSNLSDITINVENESIPAHKFILSSQSDFFEAMFCSQMLESKQEVIQLKEVDPYLFKLILKLTYFGELDLEALAPNTIISLFGLIERYQFNRFEEPFIIKMKSIMNRTNIWQMFDSSLTYKLTNCITNCLEYIDANCGKESLLNCDAFYQISIESLKTLLSRDSLIVSEIDLFNAISKWFDTNEVPLNEKKDIIKCIRFTLIKYEDLMNFVSDSGLVPKQQFMDILKVKAMTEFWDKLTFDKEKNRAFFVRNTNLCCDKFKFEVLKGKVGDIEGEDKATKKCDDQIVVKFGFPFNINYIEMNMSHIKGDRFSYKVEYSADSVIWKVLYNYSQFTCSNSQTLFFEPIIAQFFRINGTHQLRMDSNTKTTFDAIDSFACYYYKRKFKVERIDGLLSTPFYVHQIQDRIYHDSNAVLDPNDRYYSRSLSSNKPIIVALDQPVMIDSFSFQLWDKDMRAYSYCVEVYDGKDWIKVADKSSEECRSWQVITFSRRPISILRVRGFRIHFVECNEFRIIKFRFPKV